jgi:phosphoribosylformylglycinamidine synthase
MSVKVNVLYLPGTNCQRETALAFTRVGAEARILFLTDVLGGQQRLDDADILCLPGGFAHGDHVGAGTIAALHLTRQVPEQLAACRRRPVLCICNGFQIGVRAGLFGPNLSLTVNIQGTFRHVHDQRHVIEADNDSPWLKGLGGATMRFPCAHGEGRFLFQQRQSWRAALRYPNGENPDGSTEGIAGITATDGLILGLMNHPERAQQDPLNLEIFRNGVQAVRA